VVGSHQDDWQGHADQSASQDGKIKPEDVERLNRAFTLALCALSLVDRNDPVCEIVAKKVIEVDAAGTHDPEAIAAAAATQLGSC
jgi:hypothetical protein